MKSPSELGVSVSRLKNIYESHILLLYIIAGQVATSFKACGQGVARSTSLHPFHSHFFTPVQIAHIYALLSIKLHSFFMHECEQHSWHSWEREGDERSRREKKSKEERREEEKTHPLSSSA